MKINKREVEIQKGNITEVEVDAIVNAANNEGWMGGGVALAIRNKGGKIIEEEAVSKGPVKVGEAWVTTSGNLKAKYVIHAAVMAMDFKTDTDLIKKATLNSLKRAEELNLKTIAFPALGCGVGRIPFKDSAKAMFGAVKEYSKNKNNLQKFIFVLYDSKTYNDFKEAISATKI